MNNNNLAEDKIAALGLGAMIVFVASIMLAAIVGASLILLHEQITQQGSKTTEDTRRGSINSIIIVGGWVWDTADDMLFMMEFGSSGEAVERLDVWYQLSCTEPDGDYFYRSAALGDSDGGSTIYVWEVGDPAPGQPGYAITDNFEPGKRYFFTLDGGFQGSPGTLQCGPVHLAEHTIDADLWLHLPNGMSTHQSIALSNGNIVGSQII